MRFNKFDLILNGAFAGSLAGVLFFLLEISSRFVYLYFWTHEQAPVGYFEFLLYYAVAGCGAGIAIALLTTFITGVRNTRKPWIRWVAITTGLAVIIALGVVFAQIAGTTELSLMEIAGHLATILSVCFGFVLLFEITRRIRRSLGVGRLVVLYAVLIAIFVTAHLFARSLFRMHRIFVPVSSSVRDTSQPNILLLSVDTLRADHLGAYGYEGATSPNIDRIAANGALFEKAISQAPWTRPSFGSLLTSVYPSQHGAFVVNDPKKDGLKIHWKDMLYNGRLREESVTMAEILRSHGYHTVALQSNWQASAAQNFDQGFDLFLYDSIFTIPFWDRTFLGIYGSWMPAVFGGRRRLPFYTTPPNADEVYSVFSELASTGVPEPFFIWINFMDPHSPYLLRDKGVPVEESKVVRSYESWDTETPVASLKKAYDSEIRFADHYVGKVLETLDKSGLLDRTIVVFVSDHGEDFEDHPEAIRMPDGRAILGRHHGHSVYQELLRVPLLIQYPSQIPAGMKLESPVCLIDVMPTVLDLAGINPGDSGHGFQGQSFARMLTANAELDEPRYCYSERTYYDLEERSIQNQSFKLIYRFKNDAVEVYDLAGDPRERKNLAEILTETRASLFAKLTQWMYEMGPLVPLSGKSDQSELTKEDQQRLRSLGYLH